MMRRHVLLAAAALVATCAGAAAQAPGNVTIRGHVLPLHVSGPPNGEPVVISSGDGGWIHLAPQVAEMLARKGYFVVGFDSKAYLESFTTHASTLSASDVPGDFRELIGLAASATGKKPLLVGVSEGGALSALAVTDPQVKAAVAGVIALGLGDINELGWRWKDALIYLTHGVPNEPTFSVRALVPRIAPLPLAIINSTRDEFVTREEVDRIVDAAGTPKRLWMVAASDHRFSDNQADLCLRLQEAIDWVRQSLAR